MSKTNKQDKFKFVNDEEKTKEENISKNKEEKISKEEKNEKEIKIAKEQKIDKKQKNDKDNNTIEKIKKETKEETKTSNTNKQDKVNDIKLPDTKTINEPINETNDNQEYSNNSVYISFEMRVAFMVLLILVSFGIACSCLIEAFNYNESEVVNYNENSQVDYKVCLDENNDYSDECLGENMEYLSLITKNIPITLRYNVDFSQKIEYDLDYYVRGELRIVDNGENDKVLYTSEDVLVSNTKLKDNSENITFSTVVDVDFKKYNNYVTSYKSRYSLNADAYLDVVLYLNEEKGPRKLSTVTIPLGEQTYGITKEVTSNNNKSVVVKDQGWTQHNIVFAAIGTVFILIGLLVLIRLTTLIVKIANHSSKYQQKLNQILREYDRIIVTAREGFKVNEAKTLIKLETFDELLDARDALEKPIIYVKINEVKSEFYVEDDDKIYRFTLKDV